MACPLHSHGTKRDFPFSLLIYILNIEGKFDCIFSSFSKEKNIQEVECIIPSEEAALPFSFFFFLSFSFWLFSYIRINRERTLMIIVENFSQKNFEIIKSNSLQEANKSNLHVKRLSKIASLQHITRL